MSFYDTVMSDTVGVAYRAATGSVDPWTKSELQQQEATDLVQASGGTVTPEAASDQAQQDITDTLTTFSLGGGDPVGADPSQAHISLPSGQALSDTASSLANNNGSGCGITNLGGCITIPSWVWWVGGGIAALLIVGYAVNTASKAKAIVS